MPATVTLSSTTLADALSATADRIKLTSTAGVYPGMCLFLDGELVRVISIPVDPWVRVQRGCGGTTSVQHLSGVTVHIGNPDQFYESDPTGKPSDAIPVSPWINVRNGAVWFAQGDPLGERWWQKQVTSHDVGALGVRTTTQDPTSST